MRDTVFVDRPLPPPPPRVDTVRLAPTDPGWADVTIFYATDRRPEGPGAAPGATGPDVVRAFGRQRADGDALHYGTATVTIPRNHKVGGIESPAWYHFEFRPNPQKHFTVSDAHPLDGRTAFDTLRAMVARSDSGQGGRVFVFIHGYNVKFSEAVMRTAQLAYDLGFRGAPVLYSWPSQGSLRQYVRDGVEARWSAPHLARFLDSVATVTGARQIDVIAHSMGADVAGQAFRAMAPQHRDTIFNQVVLAAPDIDVDTFRRQIAPAMRRLARRTTLYESADDEALNASRALAGHQRVGEARPVVVVVDGLDAVDATGFSTDLIGHGYFASNRVLLNDLFQVLTVGSAPDGRNLRPRGSPPAPRWWAFP